jgi:predicted enzyme related to lactoylglutathione lyase
LEVKKIKNIFNWVEIRVRDLGKAQKFYGSLFDWKINGNEDKDFAYWTLTTGEKPGGGLWRMPKEKPTGVYVYIMVENIEKTLENVAKLGGKVIVPKSRESGNAMATFADPDGNLFGLYEYAKE